MRVTSAVLPWSVRSWPYRLSMALVRCTCIAELVQEARGNTLVVALPDPDCGYVPHRLGADLPTWLEPETPRG